MRQLYCTASGIIAFIGVGENMTLSPLLTGWSILTFILSIGRFSLGEDK